mgnify:CR=1 FL=1
MRLKKQVGEHAHRSHRSTQIFSHAENPSMRARFSGHAPKGQKFIAQGKRSDALGIMRSEACALLRAKVLKQSVLCLLLPFQGVG